MSKPEEELTPTSGASKVDFNDVFSLRKPKDAKAGLSSGLKSLAKGVLGGAVGLIAAPVVGATQDGFVGFAKGLATGVVGAVVLPVAGVGVGLFQIGRGVVNQSDALVQTSRGKIWDEERRSWVEKPDGSVVLSDRTTRRFLKRSEAGEDYYELLQVTKDATPEHIKKQYYMLARKWHPDKNPGDETAHAKFQSLGEAYQVLCNADLRAKYDEHGSKGLDVNFMDGGEFFNMLFGNDLFEHLVGELMMAAAARTGGDLTAAEMKGLQHARLDKLTVNLTIILKRWVAGDCDGFKLAMTAEAEKLVGASFGETMLHALGKVYESQSDIALGNIFQGAMAKMRLQGDSIRSQFQAASAAIKVFQAQQKIEAWQRESDERTATAAVAAAKAALELAAANQGGSTHIEGVHVQGSSGSGSAPNAGSGQQDGHSHSDSAAAATAGGSSGTGAGARPNGDATTVHPEEVAAAAAAAASAAASTAAVVAERAKLEEAALPLMLEAMWAANVLDIQVTLRKVCIRVLEEVGVSKAELKERALGLRELGRIFQEARVPQMLVAHGTNNPRRQMEEAMQRVMEKRHATENEDH
ncbi:MAG: hypothetical protein WDW38_010652 [Sanguina aurantia]